MPKRGIINEDLREYVLRLNAERSSEYTDPGAQYARQLYRRKHRTQILVGKCMDGRLNLPVFTKTPAGILQPFRNIGGRFDFGWPFYQEVIINGVDYAISKGRMSLLISSYHFSKGEKSRGCAGFGYDTEAAKDASFKLREQAARVFGNTVNRAVYSLAIGIETDEESLIFHGHNNSVMEVAKMDIGITDDEIVSKISTLYPDMDRVMQGDLLPLIRGNIEHVAEKRSENVEPIDLEHREQIIAVGRGFDWLHEPNRALIIGPYSHEWPDAVATASDIVTSNIEEGRIPADRGVLLLVAALWRSEEGEAGRRLKEEKVRYMTTTSLDRLKEKPTINRNLQVLAGVVNADTRKLDLVDL